MRVPVLVAQKTGAVLYLKPAKGPQAEEKNTKECRRLGFAS